MIAVENTPTRASAFNLSDPAVVVNERAVTSRHRNEEYSSNPHPVSGSSAHVPSGLRSGCAMVDVTDKYGTKEGRCSGTRAFDDMWRHTVGVRR